MIHGPKLPNSCTFGAASFSKGYHVFTDAKIMRFWNCGPVGGAKAMRLWSGGQLGCEGNAPLEPTRRFAAHNFKVHAPLEKGLLQAGRERVC